MAKVESFYYLTETGRSPVREFVDALDYKTQRKFFSVRELLEEFGHRLPQPHAKYIGDDIFELRFSSQEGKIRVLYFFFRHDKVIFTNGFVKKTAKTPPTEKALAAQRRAQYLKS